METSDWISLVALVVSVLTAGGSIYGWYHSRFRYSEVLAWSQESIRAMQKLLHLLEAAPKSSSNSHADNTQVGITEASTAISALVEVGRIFFKNSAGEGNLKAWGASKPPAYRGIRPKILDYLVACCDAAREWPLANAARRADLIDAVRESERQFVSLVQLEVGRARTLSTKTSQQGTGSPLVWILHDLRARETESGIRRNTQH